MSKIASSAAVRVVLGFFLAFIAVFFSTAPLRAQTSNDSNFTPSVLTSGLSSPDGVVFRSSTGDLLVTQSGQISTVKATNGSVGFFATQTNPDKVSVRASDGLVAVITQPFGPIVFYSSSGALQDSFDPTSAIIAASLGQLTGGPLCLAGAVFDTSGNLFVAAGLGDSESETNPCPPSTNWGIYEFANPTPWTGTVTFVTGFASTVAIQDMAYSAARPPLGTLYAIDSSNNGGVYEIPLPACSDCDIFPISNIFDTNSRGIAVDPLLGDIYVTDFSGGKIYRIPAPGNPGDPPSTTFATGFTSPLRLDFDTTGNLYVNDSGTGELWKFARASNATGLQAVTQGQFNFLSFVNPNGAMGDQTQNIMIPSSAILNGTAFIQDIFVSVNPATLNTTLQNGTTGDPSFFGGTGVPSETTCIPVPSAGNNCVVVIQKCYDANHNPFAICPVQEPPNSTDLIQLTFGYAAPSAPRNPTVFLIGFDDGDGNDITDITSKPFDCCTGSGSGKSLCSKTFGGMLPDNFTPADFTISVAADPVDLTSGNPNTATVTVKSSAGTTAFDVNLGVSDMPPGFYAKLDSTDVSVGGGSSATSILTVSVSTSTTMSGVSAVIANLLASSCIDKSGIANALSSKLSAAQADISSGQIKTAINVLSALNDLVKAQSGKHIAATCTTAFPLLITGTASVDEVRSTTENVTYNPGTLLVGDINALLASLRASVSAEDPITGFVVDSSGGGAPATVTITNGVTTLTAYTDGTGFYYFPNTGTLTVGQSYTIQVTSASATPPSPQFTWMGKGLAFNFTLN